MVQKTNPTPQAMLPIPKYETFFALSKLFLVSKNQTKKFELNFPVFLKFQQGNVTIYDI
jgi:hypothetical protein